MKIQKKKELIIDLLDELASIRYNENFNRYYKKVKMMLRRCFTIKSEIYKDFEQIDFWYISLDPDEIEGFKYWERGMKNLRDLLEVIIEELNLESLEPNSKIDENKHIIGTLNDLETSLIHKIYEEIITNPTRYHKESRSIIPQRKKAVKLRDKFTCQLCNNDFEEHELEVDHILPYGAGGSNEEYNLMALCEECNRNKSARLDYYRSDEGKFKLMENIKIVVKTLPMIHDFGVWLEKMGDQRRRK